MQKETGLELLVYLCILENVHFNADLKKHTDRPACEVSVTVMIGSDGTTMAYLYGWNRNKYRTRRRSYLS
jgi:hypothetical protein